MKIHKFKIVCEIFLLFSLSACHLLIKNEDFSEPIEPPVLDNEQSTETHSIDDEKKFEIKVGTGGIPEDTWVHFA